jgi:hypothetical protein
LIAPELSLLENGTVGGARGTEYTGWDVIDERLCFFNVGSFCTYRFNTVTRRDDGALDFTGRYTLDIEAVRGVTLSEDCPTLPELMSLFESFGDTCEFGIAQRYYGVEPLDLFRFTGISAGNLLKALTDRMAAFDHPDAITLTLRDDSQYYFAEVKAYGMNFHTFRDSGKMQTDEVRALVRKKLLFTRRKLFEDLEEGNRMYMRKRGPGETLAQIIPVYELLQSFGHRTLLWVTLADNDHPDGTVELVRDRLYRGYVARFAEGRLFALTVNAPSWAKLCRKVVLFGSAPPQQAAHQAAPMRWTATRETYIKASANNSSTLQATDKFLAKEGETVEAAEGGVAFDHIMLKTVRLGTVALPDRTWYLWGPHWQRS